MRTKDKGTSALLDLNTFHAIQAVLEGGCVHSASGQRASAKIIRICEAEKQKLIRVWDGPSSMAKE